MQNTQSSDILLIEAFKSGSEQAFTQLFHTYNEWLYAEAAYRCQNSDDAKDIVQEVFKSLWEKRATIDAEKDIQNFLYICMRNACVNMALKVKARQNYAALHQHQQELFVAPPTGKNEAALAADEEDLIHQVQKAVEAIHGKAAKNAIQKHYLGGKSVKEIALETGQPMQSIRNALSRGLKFLRENTKFRF